MHSPVALAPLAYAQHITGMTGRISRIFVEPQDGRDQEVKAALVRLAAGRLNVEPATYDATLFNNAAAPANESTALFAVISALVGFLFAFNAMLLTVPARRALIADLRLDGYGSRTIAEVMLFDALVLGVLSSLLGLALGDEISLRLFRANPGYLSFAFPVGSQRIVTWQSVAIAVAGGMLAACAGVLLPLRDVSAQPSRMAVTSEHPPLGDISRGPARWRGLPGESRPSSLSLRPSETVIGVVALTVALLALFPALIRGVLGFVPRLTLDLKASAPFIAVNELRSPSTWSRTIAIAATGAVAVFGSVAIDGTRRDLERGPRRIGQGHRLDGSSLGYSGRRIRCLRDDCPFADETSHLFASLVGVQ